MLYGKTLRRNRNQGLRALMIIENIGFSYE
jgi:hypothetical protein